MFGNGLVLVFGVHVSWKVGNFEVIYELLTNGAVVLMHHTGKEF